MELAQKQKRSCKIHLQGQSLRALSTCLANLSPSGPFCLIPNIPVVERCVVEHTSRQTENLSKVEQTIPWLRPSDAQAEM